MNTLTKKILITTLAISSFAAIAIALLKDVRWASGFFVAALWSMANLFLTANILEIATLQRSKKQLYAVLLLKFPFLYILGFLVLVFKLFPLLSVLSGMVPLLLISGVIRLWPKMV